MLKSYILLLSIVTILGCGNNNHADHQHSKATEKIKLCPVTQEKIGSMGPGVEYVHEGKTYILCCKMCINTFKRNPEKYINQES